MATASPFRVILDTPGTVLATCPVPLRVSHFVHVDSSALHVSHNIDVHSLGDVRSLGDSATLGAEAAREVATDQNSGVTQSWRERQRYPEVYIVSLVCF
jgi:hypothetical protein